MKIQPRPGEIRARMLTTRGRLFLMPFKALDTDDWYAELLSDLSQQPGTNR